MEIVSRNPIFTIFASDICDYEYWWTILLKNCPTISAHVP